MKYLNQVELYQEHQGGLQDKTTEENISGICNNQNILDLSKPYNTAWLSSVNAKAHADCHDLIIEEEKKEIVNEKPPIIPTPVYLQKDLLKSPKSESENSVEDTVHRNGVNHQSFTQKIIKKASRYHFSKNYKQQRNSYAKRILAKTKVPMNFETFKQELTKYSPKPTTKPDKKTKESAFIERFQNAQEKELVTKIFQKCVRKTFVLMYETEMRRSNMTDSSTEIYEEDSSSNEESEKNNENNSVNKCLDDIGNDELMNSFDNIYKESVKEFMSEKQKLKIPIAFNVNEFREKLEKNVTISIIDETSSSLQDKEKVEESQEEVMEVIDDEREDEEESNSELIISEKQPSENFHTDTQHSQLMEEETPHDELNQDDIRNLFHSIPSKYLPSTIKW